MTVSNSTTFSMTGDQIVNAALRKIAALGDGQSPSATQLSNGTQALNVMLKLFQTKGMPLWAMVEYTMPLSATKIYNFGIGQTFNIPAPLKVTQAFLVDNTTFSNQPLKILPHYDYNLLSNMNATGVPTNLWYEPQNQTGVLHLWPTPDTTTIANKSLVFTYQRPSWDQVSGTDTLDFPQWWHDAVIYNLAWRLAPEYGLPLADRNNLQKEAIYFLEEALSFSTEEGSLYIMPDWTT